MNKNFKRITALLLAVALLVCAIPTMAFASEKQVNYLFMGDSMSYNFVNGRNHYTTDLGVNDNYPRKIAEYFGFNVLNNPDAEADAFTRGGVRTTDIYMAFNDNYNGDGYTEAMYDPYKEEDIEEANQMLKNADVITIQLGHANVSTYGLAQLGADLGLRDDGFGNDLERVFTKEQIERVKPIIQECIQSLNLGKLQLEKIEKSISNKLAGKYRDKIVDALGSDTVETIENILPKAKNVVDTITYILVSDMVHFDELMNIVYQKNPDAKVFVIGLFNPAKGIKFTYKLNKTTINIPFGNIVGKMFTTMNKYYRVYSEYSNRYYYVKPATNVETYADLLGKTGEYSQSVTEEILLSYMTDEEAQSATVDQKKLAKELAPGIAKLMSDKKINLNTIIDGLDNKEGMNQITNAFKEKIDFEIAKKALKLNENGEFANSDLELERVAVKLWIFNILKGIALHPTKVGHETLYQNLLKAMKNPVKDLQAQKLHKDLKKADVTVKVVKTIDQSNVAQKIKAGIKNVFNKIVNLFK